MTGYLSEAKVRAQVRFLRQKRPDEASFMGIHSNTPWNGPELLKQEDGDILVSWCPSVLAVREALVDRPPEEGQTLVLVTNQPEDELGGDVLARIARNRLFRIKDWEMVLEIYKARTMDPKLSNKTWLARALIEASEHGAPSPVRSGLLDSDTAWRTVLNQRYAFPHHRLDLDGILSWAEASDGKTVLRAEDDEVRSDVIEWIESQVGSLGRRWMTVALDEDSPSIHAIGLVLDVLLDESGAKREGAHDGLIRLEQHFGGGPLSKDEGARWRKVVVNHQLTAPSRPSPSGFGDEGRIEGGRLMESFALEADALLESLRARDLCHHSAILPSGELQRLDQLAGILEAIVDDPKNVDEATFEACLKRAEEHHRIEQSEDRRRRIRMAGRLARHLMAGETIRETGLGLETLARHYARSTSFIDLARNTIWSNDSHNALAQAYRRLFSRCRRSREEENRSFGKALASSKGRIPPTASGLLAMEDALRVRVAPILEELPVLVLVLDGLSFPCLHALMEDFVGEEGWTPLLPEGQQSFDVLLTLFPSLTEVCRPSLLSGKACSGGQNVEVKGFREHEALAKSCKGGKPPVLFHKGALEHKDGGLEDDLRSLISDPDHRVVGIVLNFIDDHLYKNSQAPLTLRISKFPLLKQILDSARNGGRAIAITGDHGHVLEQNMTFRGRGADAGGDRFRQGKGKLEEDELFLEGERVPRDGTVILPSTECVRYCTASRCGYHGGASPQEALVPLVILHGGMQAPTGWRDLTWKTPTWWYPADATPENALELTTPAKKGKSKPGKPKNDPGQATLFAPPPSVPSAEAAASSPAALAKRIMASELFEERLQRYGRGMPKLDRIRNLLVNLLERGGTNTIDGLARVCEMPAYRVGGFVATLQKVLNHDGIAVLTQDVAAHSVTLDPASLQDQFDA